MDQEWVRPQSCHWLWPNSGAAAFASEAAGHRTGSFQSCRDHPETAQEAAETGAATGQENGKTAAGAPREAETHGEHQASQKKEESKMAELSARAKNASCSAGADGPSTKVALKDWCELATSKTEGLPATTKIVLRKNPRVHGIVVGKTAKVVEKIVEPMPPPEIKHQKEGILDARAAIGAPKWSTSNPWAKNTGCVYPKGRCGDGSCSFHCNKNHAQHLWQSVLEAQGDK